MEEGRQHLSLIDTEPSSVNKTTVIYRLFHKGALWIWVWSYNNLNKKLLWPEENQPWILEIADVTLAC